MIVCALCGTKFDEDVSRSACGPCPLVKHCHHYRCPNCGYENAPPTKLFDFFKRKGGHNDNAQERKP